MVAGVIVSNVARVDRMGMDWTASRYKLGVGKGKQEKQGAEWVTPVFQEFRRNVIRTKSGVRVTFYTTSGSRSHSDPRSHAPK
jgi:hypothetical protein